MAEEKNETEIEETGAEAPAEPAADDVADAADVAEGAVPSGESPPSGADEAAEEPVAEAAAEPDATEASGDDADVAVGAEGTVPSAGSSQAEPKPKKKRLPRALRPARTRRRRVPSSGRKPIVRLPATEGERGRRQERQGTVVSDAMDKTIVVKVEVTKAHRRYKKVVRRSVKFHAHDEGNEAKVGDIVRIVETRPLSATKRWRLVEIVEAAK